MRAESDGRTLVGGRPPVSSAGAMGLMQLMPGTWRDMRAWLGLGADPFDPHDNIIAGAAYLRLMYDRFGYPGLFDAYNAGPGRYSAWLSGARPLPSETVNYVSRVAGPVRARARARAPAPARIFALRPGTAQPPEAAPDASFATPRGAGAIFVTLGGG